MNQRKDRLTALHVDLCISLADVHGVAAGARELFQLGLPIELARRVLLRPAERRGDRFRRVKVRISTCAPCVLIK